MAVHNVVASIICAFCCGGCIMNRDTAGSVLCGVLTAFNFVLCFVR